MSETLARRFDASSRHASGVVPELDVDRLLDDRSVDIIVCCGAGGVGKTTTAASLGVRAAERGRRVIVITVDPARRLAQAMGIDELDNTPRSVAGIDDTAGGTLRAMMLDMKQTFDDLVTEQGSPELAARVLQNPFYLSMSSSFAGTSEYMAMEKLAQLRAETQRDDSCDLIVVDTPPARSALDFLDAPERLAHFLDGRFIRLLVDPPKGTARLLQFGLRAVTRSLQRILGKDTLTDFQDFVVALDTVLGGVRERSEETYRVLKGRSTAFLVVATPDPDALREATYFVERLGEDDLVATGVVINKLTLQPAAMVTAEQALGGAEELWTADPDSRSAAVLRLHADRVRLSLREKRTRLSFEAAHPSLPTAVVPGLAGDVHDLDGLRRIGALMNDEDATGE
ncbi:AAA family ATPase [Nocardioides panacisoli]|uniref:ArsA family ATPase n=1 Tax=Nocardioides panacisoli TaxID=627624 RepID=UPI001C6257CE|nr:ArsA-related P-loop ATPase [Nocardioides panacisoli]QYJ05747.1 AAA family ATPase [Nocardioides panacisoli]